jgi:LPXTG-motif cell wall-anchored protein
MLARRLLIASGMTLASLSVVSMVPAVAGAASFTPETPKCASAATTDCISSPTVSATSTVPSPALPYTATPDAPTPGVTTPADATTSSLPFTGADVEELAAVGLGAVLVGGVLMRRRRRVA